MLIKSGKPTAAPRTTGVSLIAVGIGMFMLSLLIESGFFHGLFQGMTMALLAFGVYLIARSRRAPRTAGGKDELWLPSRDRK